ncbi:MAG: VC0807 family protein [bacterium]
MTIPAHKPRPMIDLLVSIVLPSVILMNFSGESELGPAGALVVALAFPVGWGLFELIRYRKFNFIALLGLISVLLTGGIGLFELDPFWLAVKEAAIPAIIGLAVLISTYTPYPLIRTLIFNPKVMNVDKIGEALDVSGNREKFDTRLMNATYMLAGSFFFSAIANYGLARWVVKSPAGSEAFNEELGRMTLLSYPIIAVPSMIMTAGVLYYLWKTIKSLTGLDLDDMIAVPADDQP